MDMVNSKIIVFIHGLFMNPYSWAQWTNLYERRGYICFSPAYPFHEGNPVTLRNNINPELGKLTLGQVVDGLSAYIDLLPGKPVLIGHSMGGLVVQKLIALNKGVAGVCIDPAPPAGLFSFQWSFLKANLSTVNPLKGNSVFLPDLNWFHYAFCNTMTIEQTRTEYIKYLVPESRNIARTSTGTDGKIDFNIQHNPLLIIAGEKDNIVPSSLVRKNFEAYKEKSSKIDFHEFPGRCHYICNQSKWEEVALYVDSWIESLR
jgi:pimeloyl-ACP methyl ester carboxylesterase